MGELYDLVIHNIGELVTPRTCVAHGGGAQVKPAIYADLYGSGAMGGQSQGSAFTGNVALGGEGQGDVLHLKDAWVAVKDGLIAEVGSGAGSAPDAAKRRDGGGRLATPGLVDPHTHLVFAGWRERELGDKLRGVPYLDILAAGGGILSTVRATRAATEMELTDHVVPILEHMMGHGVTTCEVKSGYGLTCRDEMKQLNVIKELASFYPLELVPTLMAAHAIPSEYKDDREGYVRLVIDEIIPAVAQNGLAEFCDVFCERGVFTVEESERILRAGLAAGLAPKCHCDEIEAIGGTEMAAGLGAVSCEHLICCTQTGIEALAESQRKSQRKSSAEASAGASAEVSSQASTKSSAEVPVQDSTKASAEEPTMASMKASAEASARVRKNPGTIACLLPATSFYLDAPFAPARELMSAGVPVAIGSDFNPGSCPVDSLLLAMQIGCYKYRMTPEETLTAVTQNAAAALGRGGRTGSLEAGKQADIVLWDAPNLDYIFYRFGANLVQSVYKKGDLVAETENGW
ncbi:MAG: imidazolonepropionase [Lachnospiraceae bacterium]|nr:imidazolonepropionase [Lachnospiraceae bacterium]